MIEKIKKEAMKQGMKLMSNPKFMKMMADPRVMMAITQGFAFKGKLQAELDERLRTVIDRLNLATKEEVSELKRTLSRMEGTVVDLEKKVD